MERGKKDIIIFKKYEKQGKETIIPIYMIDEVLTKEFINSMKKREEYKNSWLVKNVLPKDLFNTIEMRSRKFENPTEQYNHEKELKFKLPKCDNDILYLSQQIDKLEII